MLALLLCANTLIPGSFVKSPSTFRAKDGAPTTVLLVNLFSIPASPTT